MTSTPPRPWWAVLGLVLSVVVAVAGLAVLGYFVVLAVGISMWASNK